jgi:sirohydrochlorin cobaltochelatase
MKCGLLLFAHGARDPIWAEPFVEIMRRIRLRDPQLSVQLAFLELMKPSLGEAAAVLAEIGCKRVDVVPLFLGAGGHVRADLPALLTQVAATHSDVQWALQPPVGELDSVIEAIALAAAKITNEPGLK